MALQNRKIEKLAQTPLQRQRVRVGLTVRALAELVEIDPSTLNRVENGISRASPELATRIAKYFNGSLTRDQILFPEDYAPRKKAS